jgi:fumarate hydratase class I
MTSTLLRLPATEEDVRALSAGDVVRVTGRIVTARQAALRQLVRSDDAGGADDAALRAWASGGAVYHCSPVVNRAGEGGAWRVVAAGPSESAPLEPWTAEVLERYGARAVIGLGGMGPRTLETLRRFGAVYLHATSELAVTLARRVTAVCGVHLLDRLGVAEAVWLLEVDDFPATVTMDASGVSLHEKAQGSGLRA